MRFRLESKIKRAAITVIVLGPPLNNSGGVGTLFNYAIPNFSSRVLVRFVDTRGARRNPVFSILNVIEAMFVLTLKKSMNRVDVIHISLGAKGSSYRKTLLLLFAKKVLKIPTVVQLHSSSFDTFLEASPKLLKNCIVRALNQADQILVLGDKWKTYLAQVGCLPEKLKTLQMGVPDLLSHESSSSFSEATSDKYKLKLLFAGAMGERKGLPNLLEALKSPLLRSVFLNVAGSGDLQYWKSLVVRLFIEDRVKFYGLISENRVHELLFQSDALILPSIAEGLPVSVIEGLSARKIVISTRVGSLPEFLTDGLNCFFLNDREPETIVQKLNFILQEIDSDLLETVRENGKILWKKNFDVTLTTVLLEEIWLNANNKGWNSFHA